jgi:hypothetical protein
MIGVSFENGVKANRIGEGMLGRECSTNIMSAWDATMPRWKREILPIIAKSRVRVSEAKGVDDAHECHGDTAVAGLSTYYWNESLKLLYCILP